MNKRSKSQRLLVQRCKRTVKQPSAELLSKQMNEINDLKLRIDKSKPILQAIYNKVKRKQQQYNKKILKDCKSISHCRKLANSYKQLYQKGLQKISFDGFKQKFNGKSNFFQNNQQGSAKNENDSLDDLVENLENKQNRQFQQQQIFAKPKNFFENKIKNQSRVGGIYQLYKQKIKKCVESNIVESKKQDCSALSMARKFSQQILKDIQSIKSGNNITNGYQKRQKKQVKESFRDINKKKEYFLLLQKKKLSNI